MNSPSFLEIGETALVDLDQRQWLEITVNLQTPTPEGGQDVSDEER
jgi:hypothetical protein